MNTAFTVAAGQIIASSMVSLFALIDGLQFERYFGRALDIREGSVVPLFDKYPDSRIAFAGPWLIDMQQNMSFSETLIELEHQLPSVSWILSGQTFPKLLEHLQQNLNVELPDGQIALLRFQDPRVQIRISELLNEYQHCVLTRDIVGWFSTVEGTVYSLKQKEFI
ncbi:DUF4123 domain-containing protein [Enterobacter sp.]|uniref:DUF4123 domain-containing protein n=1 Tax=Enterobacter sp. TaxID=42895 RepID=UPI003A90302B